jgi:hypothetical protein
MVGISHDPTFQMSVPGVFLSAAAGKIRFIHRRKGSAGESNVGVITTRLEQKVPAGVTAVLPNVTLALAP